MAYAGCGLRQRRYFVPVQMHHVGEPYIVAGPSQALHILQRLHTELLLTKLSVIDGLCQMRVQVHGWVLTRQFGGLFHQIGGDTKW